MQRATLFCALALALGLGGPVLGQSFGTEQSEVVVIDPQRLFRETQFGQRIAAELEAEAEELATTNRRLEEQLRAEEKELTEARPTMTPEDFRDAAEAFDKKVQAIRRERLEKARSLEEKRGSAEQRFLAAAQSVLVEVMDERGANILIDIRSTLLRDNGIDITSQAVRKIDQAIGTGEQAETPQPQPQPEAGDEAAED